MPLFRQRLPFRRSFEELSELVAPSAGGLAVDPPSFGVGDALVNIEGHRRLPPITPWFPPCPRNWGPWQGGESPFRSVPQVAKGVRKAIWYGRGDKSQNP